MEKTCLVWVKEMIGFSSLFYEEGKKMKGGAQYFGCTLSVLFPSLDI